MPATPRFPSGSVGFGLLVCAALVVAPARAQSAGDPSSFGGVMEFFGLKAKPGSTPGFVEATRPKGNLNYIPAGTVHPASPVRTMTPAELAATTDALDRARVAQQLKAGVKPPPVPLKSAAAGPPRKKTDR